MFKLSYKSLLIILLFLLIGIVILARFVLPKNKIEAAWWNDGWNYRKTVTIANNSGELLTNFRASLTINTNELINTGKMQADCDDLRVTDQNGNLLPVWVETASCNSDSTNILIKAGSIPVSSASFYLYYGNMSVNSISDISVLPRSCSEVNAYLGSGFYYLNPDSLNSTPVQAYCDMTTNGGGWTLVASWVTSQEWTKTSTSTNAVFGTTALNAVSSNFGNVEINDFRILASDAVTTSGSSAYADWYYHYNQATTWKEVWAPSANLGGFLGAGYRSTSPRHALKPFNYSYNIKFSYQVSQTWNNLGDWSYTGVATAGCLPDYWKALTSPGNPFGVYSLAYYIGSNGSGCSSAVSDGSLGICPQGQENCVTGQDLGPNNVKIGYDDGVPSAGFGSIGTTNVGINPPVNATTKLWWFIRRETPDSVSYTVSVPTPEEVGGGPSIYWKFDETSGVTAYDSMSLSNASIINATYVSEDQCISGTCLYFNGSAYVNTNFGIGRDISVSPMSISMWVKPTVSGNLMFISPNQGLNQRFYFANYNGKWDFGVQNYGWGNGTIPVVLNKWAHIEIVADGTKVIMYVDGKITHQQSYTSFTFPENIVIGQHGSSTSYRFYGYIDDVKIYPYARSSDQIKQDINSRGSFSGSSVNLSVKSNTTPNIKSSLIAHYKFDEGSGTIVNNSGTGGAVLNGNFGIGDSSPSWGNEGKFGKTIVFNDSRYIVVSSNSILNTNDSVTVSAWIKTTDSSSQQTIVSRNGPFFLRLSGGKFRVGIYTGTWYFGNGNISINSNEWYHLALVYDGSFVKSYVNGILDISSPKTGLLTAFSNLYFGRPVPGGEQYPFYGNIDEVKIYNKALTIEEIKQDYNQGSSIQFGSTSQNVGGTVTSLKYCIPGDNSYCFPPVGEWNFEENQNTQVKDESENAYHINLAMGDSSPSWSSGKSGAAVSFDGNDYINFTDSAADNKLSNLSAATYSFWIYPTSLTSPVGGDQRLLEKRDSTISSSLRTDGNLVVYFWYATNFDNWISNKKLGYYDSGVDEWTINNLNKWYFVTFVFDSVNNVGKTYINGVLDKEYVLLNCSGRATGTIGRTTVTQFGRYRYGTSNFFVGKVDDIKIYNYVRSPAQIAYDYNKGEPIAWFKFDECQGNIINNSSGIGITGIINIGSSGLQNTLGTCAVGTSAAWTNGAIGKINSSLNFDGTDDYVSMSNISFTDSQPWSFSSWINHKDGSTTFYAGRNSSNEGFLNNLSGNFAYRDKNAVYYSFSSTSSYMYKYTNLIWVADGAGNLSLYINGLLDKTISNVPTQMNFEMLGRGYSSNDYNFTGQMDDVRIYNYALTLEQIKLIYNNGAINFN